MHPFVSFLICLTALAVPFSGAELPQAGVVLHLDAATIDGVANGGPLSAGWKDSSSGSLVATSGTPPSYVADAGSGYPAVRFNGIDQYLQANVSTGNEVSVFIVFSYQRETPPVDYRDTLLAASGSGTTLDIYSSRSLSTVPDYPSFGAMAGNGITVRTWLNGLDTAAVTGDLLPRRFHVASAVYSNVPAASILVIGSGDTTGSRAGRNDIREILVYDRALSEGERESVQRYLGSKYDIELVWRSLDHPVEAWPHVLGSQQFGPHYSFGESGISTLDYARATLRQGNRVIKFRLSNKYANTDGFTQVASINTLIELVRDQPEVKTILDLPLTDYLFWVSSFSVPSWQSQLDANGLKPDKAAAIYNEVYDMVVYLLTTYSGTGKRFYVGNWEGDWMLSGEFRNDPNTIPANRIQGMIDWANIRQKAVDDAKAATPHNDVDAWFYLEMNKADWMREGLPCVANTIIPAMPKLDMISISSYSVHKDSGSQAPQTRVHSDLDQVQSLIDAKPDPSIPGSRIIIGEYGWIYNENNFSSLEEFAHAHRITARNYVSWQGGTLRFILQWQFFNSATLSDTNPASKEMCQIGPDNDLRPLYYLHENFYRLMRRWVDDYHTRTGSLPDARAYADQANHVLGFVSLSDYNPVLSFNTYDTWKKYHFRDKTEAANPAISGPDADPYDSGIQNLLRYGLGMGKFLIEDTKMPHLRWNGDSIAYAIPFDSAKTDIRWLVKAGSSPGSWSHDLFDSSTDSPVLMDGWMEVTAEGTLAPGDPAYYQLNLQIIP